MRRCREKFENGREKQKTMVKISAQYLCSIRPTTLRAASNARRCVVACSRQQSHARAVHLQGSRTDSELATTSSGHLFRNSARWQNAPARSPTWRVHVSHSPLVRLSLATCHVPVKQPPSHLAGHTEHPSLLSRVLVPAVPRPRQASATCERTLERL